MTNKGQFMVISAMLISLIVMSASAAISDVQSQEFNTDDKTYYIELVHSEAAKVDQGSDKEIRNFRELVDSIGEYSGYAEYWNRDGPNDCFNVTLRRPGTSIYMECVEVDN